MLGDCPISWHLKRNNEIVLFIECVKSYASILPEMQLRYLLIKDILLCRNQQSFTPQAYPRTMSRNNGQQ